MPVFKVQLFISVSKTLYTQIPAYLVPNVLLTILIFARCFLAGGSDNKEQARLSKSYTLLQLT